MESLLHDVRHALRVLRKTPAFAAAALLILALGIGANTAIFSVVSAVLLRPLPFGEPDRLMRLWHVPPEKQFPGMKIFSLSAANFTDWKQQNHVFEGAAIYSHSSLIRTGQGEPESIHAARVSWEFFPLLRVQPMLGRVFTAGDDQLGHEREVVVSYAYWKAHLGADKSVVGRTISLNEQNYTIVGVMGPEFRMPGWAQMWRPMAFTEKERVVRGEHHYLAFARLKPGVTVGQAQAELSNIAGRLAEQYPEDDRGWGAKVLPLREDMVSDVRPTLLVLLGAVAFVLLIGCANIANLFLAKMLSRSREIAIRAALGASRRRLLQQSLCETVVLALLGGALGVLLANYGIDLIVKFLGSNLPSYAVVRLDAWVLAFTVLLSLATGLLAGLLPAWHLAGSDVHETLKQGLGRGGSEGGKARTRNALVVAEVALSLVLLVGAGLMVRTLWALHRVDAGFDANNVLTMSLYVAPQKYANPAQEISALGTMMQRVQAVPGVESVAAVDSLPLTGGSTQPVAIQGRPPVPMADQPEVAVRIISPEYLSTMRIPLLRGRNFTAADNSGSHAVVLISQAMAHRLWPGEDPLGQRLTLTFYPGIVREVIGIIGDVKQDGLEIREPVATLYMPVAQLTNPQGTDWRSFGLELAVRTKTDAAGLGPTVVKAIHEVDAEVPVIEVQPMQAIVDDSLAQQRFTMLLLAAFAGLAVVLAASGIYSVLAYAVRRRVREIGIRMALGAQVSDVLRMIVLDGLRPTLVGVAIGAAGALALGRVLTHLVYGVSTRDVSTFLAGTGLLIVVGIAASLAPALRAGRVQPVQILHEE